MSDSIFICSLAGAVACLVGSLVKTFSHLPNETYQLVLGHLIRANDAEIR